MTMGGGHRVQSVTVYEKEALVIACAALARSADASWTPPSAPPHETDAAASKKTLAIARMGFIASLARDYSPASTFSASERVNPGVAAISSTFASRTAFSEPNFRSSAFFRFGPTPEIESSADRIPAFARTLR